MKKRFLICLLLVLGWNSLGTDVWAIDVKWMQKGVRVWYFGESGNGISTSDVEEAYLFGAANGHDIFLTRHSGITHWGLPSADTNTYSRISQGPCWIHPQVLQNIQVGDNWMGIDIKSIYRNTYNSYNDFKNNNAEFNSIPYLLLPIKALFDLAPQRNVVKLVYGNLLAPDFDAVAGTAFFDAETGLCLFNIKLTLTTTVFFILSEINYDFATQKAFAEDNGPHTGFGSGIVKSDNSTTQMVRIQSLVETRYADTVQMWVTTSAGGSLGRSYMPPNENYCFFGSVPVLRHKLMTATPNYPPENWNEYGQYLWWWVPADVLQKSTINVFGVPMTRTSTAPYTFTATGIGTGLYFSTIIFDNDGYMTDFSAKLTAIGLDIGLGSDALFASPPVPIHLVDGLAYYKNNMGTALPDANPNVEPDIITPETNPNPDNTTPASDGGGGGGGGCFIATAV
jgi:hypothetical protein